MISLEIMDLGVVHKFLELQVKLDDKEKNVLEFEVIIDLLLKERGLDNANGDRTPIIDDCNEADALNAEILPSMNTAGLPSVKTFQSVVMRLL